MSCSQIIFRLLLCKFDYDILTSQPIPNKNIFVCVCCWLAVSGLDTNLVDLKRQDRASLPAHWPNNQSRCCGFNLACPSLKSSCKMKRRSLLRRNKHQNVYPNSINGTEPHGRLEELLRLHPSFFLMDPRKLKICRFPKAYADAPMQNVCSKSLRGLTKFVVYFFCIYPFVFWNSLTVHVCLFK